MALTSILTPPGDTAVFVFNRGNGGVLVDIVAKQKIEFATPLISLDSAVFPSVNDVETGVAYGPNGTDYTGTVTLPAEADVETGVQFGANGTEFTGTLTGGGGGEHSAIF